MAGTLDTVEDARQHITYALLGLGQITEMHGARNPDRSCAATSKTIDSLSEAIESLLPLRERYRKQCEKKGGL